MTNTIASWCYDACEIRILGVFHQPKQTKAPETNACAVSARGACEQQMRRWKQYTRSMASDGKRGREWGDAVEGLGQTDAR